MVASLGYQGSESRHLLVQSNFNVIAGAEGVALNPVVNSIDYYANTGTGNYNAMIATLKHTFSHQFNVEAQYTWGKAMDENSGCLAMTVRAAADRADAVRAKFARAGH